MAGLESVAIELYGVVVEANSFESDELEAVAEEQVEVVAPTQRTVYSDTGDSIAELFVADIGCLDESAGTAADNSAVEVVGVAVVVEAEQLVGKAVGTAEQNRNSLKNSKRMDSRSLAGKMSIVVVGFEADRLEMDNTTEELDFDSKQRRTESHWLERILVERRFV